MSKPRRDRPKSHVPETKSFSIVSFKALKESDAPGTYEAIVSVFGNIDSYGDRMQPGSFTRTLEERGFPPVVWSHDWLTPPIGLSLDAREITGDEADEIAGRRLDILGGLYTKSRLLVDQAAGEDHPVARMVWAAMTAEGGDGRAPLKEFSFGYRTRRAQWVEEDPETLPPDAQWTGGEIRDILDVDLFEVGPTLVGANSETELIAAKAAIFAARKQGGVTADEIRELLDERRAEPAGSKSSEPPAEVRARLAAVDDLRPPITL